MLILGTSYAFVSSTIVGLLVLAVALGALTLALLGRFLGRCEQVRGVLEKRESERAGALRLQEAQFQSVFENTELGIVLFDPDGTVVRYNGAVRLMLGERLKRFLTEHTAEISAFATRREPFSREEMHENEDGSRQWVALKFSGVYDDAGCRLVILLLHDRTKERLLHEGLLFLADHDSLTQLANRSAFERELRTRLERDAEPFALMYVDLDEFKPILDRWGNAAADAVLVATGGRLRSGLASRDFCARLGGEEFAAIIQGRNDYEHLASIARRLETAIAEPIAFGELSVTVTASIGIAVRGAGHHTGSAMMIDADRALYRVKSQGGNGNSIYRVPAEVMSAPHDVRAVTSAP
jgi:diguanylate cyclase (GGDEF)-like protein